MMAQMSDHVAAVLHQVAQTRAEQGQRKVIGIAGPPASGKSTLAEQVVAALNEQRPGQAVLLPMDGFHMDNADLDRAGLRAVKGAPQTFDVAAFIAKVAELRPQGVRAAFPLFDRSADRTLPDAQAVDPEVQIIVVEGNYLLLHQPPWAGLRAMLDGTVMLHPTLATLEARLLERWTALGLPPDTVRAKTYGNDLVNARHVLDHSAPADLVLSEEIAAEQAR